jgi:TPR repeat protein
MQAKGLIRWRLALAGILLAAGMARADGQKGITVAPIADAAPSGNVALFVGVDRFRDDPGLNPLHFAVDDAVAQAHLFVIELKLVPAANCYLALEGDPSDDAGKQALADLVNAGAHQVEGQKTDVLKCLLAVKNADSSSSDLAIVSISSHGFEENGVAYAMPSDGLRGMLSDTGLSINTLEQNLTESKAGKRLLLIDACREKATNDSKGGDTPMTAAFHEAFASARGQATLESCDVGQISYEDQTLHHGVFTYYLLQALRGQAAANDEGFITLGSVGKYVASGVDDWVSQNKPGQGVQKPSYQGPYEAADIPLAVDPDVRRKLSAFHSEVQNTISKLRDQIDMNGPFTPDMYSKTVSVLRRLQAGDADDARVLQHASDFADGKPDMTADLFVPYLQSRLNALPKPEVVAATISASDSNSMVELGDRYRLGLGVDKDYAQSMTWYAKAADAGSAVAMRNIGDQYDKGQGVGQDDAQALIWYHKAADAGDAESMHRIGRFYFHGQGVPQDYAQAMTWFGKAADAGNANAMYDVGRLYQNGWGVEMDYLQAMTWYRKGADAGSADAMSGIGSLYANSSGVTNDDALALQWFQKSAAGGSANGMDWLGQFYENGRGGLTQDMQQARKWYQKAADTGSEHAQQWLANADSSNSPTLRTIPPVRTHGR